MFLKALVASAGAALYDRQQNGVRRQRAPRVFGLRDVDCSLRCAGLLHRIRCKDHLRYVASQPCVICGRSPSHPHHVRYAQSRGIGLKVSDEFVIPLCAIHHRQLHETTKAREWWQEQKIDPLKIAAALWRDSQRRSLVLEQKPAHSRTDLVQGASKPAEPSRPDSIRKVMSEQCLSREGYWPRLRRDNRRRNCRWPPRRSGVLRQNIATERQIKGKPLNRLQNTKTWSL
jgi:hypothetical protein